MSSCYLIIQQSGYEDRAFCFEDDELIIGREKDSGLCLPNVSVSRSHVRIVRSGRHYTIEDLGSSNGTTLDRERLPVSTPQPLPHSAHVHIGKFKLSVLIRSGRAYPIWKGKFVHQLPLYKSAGTQPQGDATFGLDRGTLLRMAEQEHRQETARIVLHGSTGSTWTPADRELLLGKNNQIPVQGFFVSSRAARVRWDKTQHVIDALSWWTGVQVNGQRISGTAPLSSGSRIRIGRSLFVYEIPPAEHLSRLRSGQKRREKVVIPSKKPPS